MPDFDARYKNRLESSLGQPFSSFSGTIFYRGVLEKAVALFYFCTKNHPFENGNKRFAVTIMLYFLLKNGYWLEIHPTNLYEIAKVVASAEESPREVIDMITKKFKPFFVELEENDLTPRE